MKILVWALNLGEARLDAKSSGNVALTCEDTGTPVVILRDTGASQSLLVRSCLPGIHQNVTGDRVLLQGIDGNLPSVALATVHIRSPFNRGGRDSWVGGRPASAGSSVSFG